MALSDSIFLLIIIFGVIGLIAYIILKKLGYINFRGWGTSTRVSIGTGGMPWGSGDNW